MALTSFISNASSTLSRATSNISTSAQTFNNSLSSFSNQIGNIESQISPQFIQNNLGSLQDKFNSVASPFTDALSSVTTSLPSLTNAVSLINPAFGNIVDSVESLMGAVSGGQADQSILGLFNPESNNVLNLGQGAGGMTADVLGSPSTNAFSTSRLPNPLRNFSSHNYQIKLGMLSRSENNSPNSSYRSSGLSKVLISSGGGEYAKRQTTATEDIFGAHGEYFIEDLEVESMIVHNSTTGATNSTGFSFRVIEPYSMGQFLEAAAAAAIELGYQAFTSAPFCFEITFTGYDSNGNVIPSGVSPKYLPFMFTDIQFDVSGEGSMYSIEAIPYNEQASIDQIQELKQDSNLRGETIAELLQTNPTNSLTNVINSRIETQEDVNAISKGDRYIIAFPPSGRDIQEAVDDITARFDQTGSTGATTASVNTSNLAGITAASSAGGGLFEQLKSWANNPSNISFIGNARMVVDVIEEGDRPAAFADLSIDINNVLRPVQRNAETTQMSDLERNFQITQGTKIMEIIADSIIQSEYGRAIIDGPSETGQYAWYKVDLKTYIEVDTTRAQQTGQDPLIYVFQVKPFLADESFFQGPSRRSNSTALLRQNALKTYNYLYTGLNEDVIDFNIGYKMAFFEAMASDLGQLGLGARGAASGETTDAGRPPPTNRAPPGIGPGDPGDPNESHVRQIESINQNRQSAGGVREGQTDSHKIRVAEMFNEALTNSVSDLINAEMEIWGDPYFIPDSGMGNFTDAQVVPGLTQSGTIETFNNENFVIVNFRLPYDYDQNTGLMTFSRMQRRFSGLYEVITVTNKFKNGQFTQTLDLMRRRSQSDEGTGDTQSIREDPLTDLSEGGNNEFQGSGGPVGGRDQGRLSDDPGSGSSAQGSTGANTVGSNPNIIATGPPTGTTPPNISYVSGFGSKIRNQAIQPQLLSILQSAAEAAGVRVVISSGGQDTYPNGNRTGSRRHDAGYAADVILYDGDRRLRVNDPEELSIVQTFIRAAKAAGATAAGAGNGYMGDQTYHIDIADGNTLSPGMRGYGARYWGTSDMTSAGAPQWLRDIMG